jgi:hypothetical protein
LPRNDQRSPGDERYPAKPSRHPSIEGLRLTARADLVRVPSLKVECLRCGDLRVLHPVSHERLDTGQCERCGYVGWAASAELDERLRYRLRRRPIERRWLRPA